jgi:hypothetical protein
MLGKTKDFRIIRPNGIVWADQDARKTAGQTMIRASISADHRLDSADHEALLDSGGLRRRP